MKVRSGFVSNSSSTSFVVVNKTKKNLTLLDFVEENPQLVKEWNAEYDEKDTKRSMIRDAKKRGTIIKPGDQILVFGDEDGDVLGRVFDYILRDGGSSKRFNWKFDDGRKKILS